MVFVVAGIVFFVTIVVCGFALMAACMSDNPAGSDDIADDVVWWFVGGMALTALIVATHWFPHIGW